MTNSFDNIRLERGMYTHSGKSFSQVLESLDPTENYRSTALEGLDAYQRQLKRFGIKARGAGSSTVEKFFQNSETAVLFPEFVARSVKAGMDAADILPAICALVTEIDASDYRPVAIPEGAAVSTDEGDELNEMTLKTRENSVKMKKKGRILTASYEALRGQKLEVLALALRQIGAGIMRSHLAEAVETIKDGDGNSNPATIFKVGTAPISGTSGKITYASLIDFWNTFDGFELNTFLVSRDMAVAMLKLAEFQNVNVGLDFQGSGKMITPLGATLIPCSVLDSGEIIGLDRTCALEMAASPSVLVEQDKLISRQLDRVAVTSAAGFAKLCVGASAVLEV